ncbi:NUDIX hydrolase [Roseobacter sp.]|uniref:NUDIX hydrolase n=1 Tax=Roseobacter sp. TaxID=1907202 RepID=UPI0025CEAF9D|nr:NUDIX hydrolase [Roseobacter sp.]
MIRRIGHAPGAEQKYVMRPGAYAVLPLGGRLLLTCQLGETPDIQLPGGGIDPGESAAQALHREVMEETGWRIAAPRRLGAFRRFAYMPEYDLWAEKICHVYVARPVYQVREPSEPDHVSLVLSSGEATAALGNDGDRLFVSRYFYRPGR